MKGKVVSFILLIFLATVPYINTLKGSFVYDDSDMVLENRNVTGRTTLYQLFFDKQVMVFPGEIYRPLRDVTYRFDFLIGKKEPFIYHASNILFHIAATLTAYCFFISLLREGSTSFIAAAIFAVHPLHTESVAWIKGRDDILFTIFYLLALTMYLKHESSSVWKKQLYFLTSLLLYILSLFSKELAITLPLSIILYQAIFKKLNLFKLIPFIVVSAIYIGLRTYVLGQVAQQEEYWGGSLYATMLTMTKGIAHYMKLTYLPINQCADYLFPISQGLDIWIIISLIFISLYLIILFVRGNGYALWGGLFFLLSLLPVLNIIPIKAIIAERFLYLPLIGFCLVFVYLLSRILPDVRIFRIMSFIIICLLFALTTQRNSVWKDEYSLWSDTVRKYPGNPRAHYGLGVAYTSKGMKEEAVREYKRSIELGPYYPDTYNALGLEYYKRGMEEGKDKNMVEAAARLYIAALKIDPGHRDARYNLALLYHEQGSLDDAMKEYSELLRYRPDDFDSLNSLGLAFFQKGLFERSLSLYRKSLDIEPNSVTPYNNIGTAHAVMGRVEEAEKWFKGAIEKDPESAEAYYNLGFLYQNNGKLDEAVKAYKKAISIRPDYEEAKDRFRELEER